MTFFLTDIDPNAKVKGSRDPLGTQSVWSNVGRTVVGNLTTQTGLLTDFRVLVIGAYLEDLFRESLGELQTFLCWEQVAAYTRVIKGGPDDGFRGVTQARRRVPDEMMVSPQKEHHLLGHQLLNGIWGLYRAAAWRGGLLREAQPQLPDETLEVVRNCYVPRLEQHWGRGFSTFRTWVQKGHWLRATQDAALIDAVAECVMGPLTPAERDLYRITLVEGGLAQRRVGGLQRELAGLLVELPSAIDRRAVESIQVKASESLADRLQTILDTESVLAPSAAVFSYVTQSGRQTYSDVVADLEPLLSDHRLVDPSAVTRLQAVRAANPGLLTAPRDESSVGEDRWIRIAQTMVEADADGLVRLLLQQNELVSRDRGGSVGWARLGGDGKVDVQQVDPNRPLTAYHDPARLWSNNYFFDQLRALALDVAVGQP